MTLSLHIAEPEGSTRRCDSLTLCFSPLFYGQIQFYPPSIIVHCQVTHNSLQHTKLHHDILGKFHITHIITWQVKGHHVQIWIQNLSCQMCVKFCVRLEQFYTLLNILLLQNILIHMPNVLQFIWIQKLSSIINRRMQIHLPEKSSTFWH